MDRCEQLAKVYLDTVFPSVVFEPQGNSTTPDFACDGTIAVEVRRLNQNEFTSGSRRGLEETSITLSRRMKILLDSIGQPHPPKSWLVRYSFRRPIPKWKTLQRLVREALLTLDPSSTLEVKIDRNFTISVLDAGDPHSKQFILGGYIDFDAGGLVGAEILKNVRTCIEEKSQTTAEYRHLYPTWWLLLVDLTGLAPGQEERKIVRCNLTIAHEWDRVMVLHPQELRSVWEI